MEVASNQQVIKYCDENEKDGFMSNFFAAPIVDDQNREWPMTEHYFQAMKHHPANPELVEQIRTSPKPDDAFRLGRSSRETMRVGWANVKDDIMMTALRMKFSQHKDLRE